MRDSFIKIVTVIFILALHLTNIQASVFINEVLSSNSTIEIEEDYPDWIEIYNDADTAICIGGYGISDKKKKPFKYVLPDSTIEAKGYLLLIADEGNSGLHTNFKIAADGEELYLTTPDGTTADHVSVPALPSNISYGRSTDGGDIFVKFSTPSPLAQNRPGNAITETPVISLKSGFYNDTITVSITSEEGDTILYTLDGSVPDSLSNIYSAPLVFDTVTVLRAITYKKGYVSGTPASATFLVRTRKPELPVITLITDPKNLYDDSIGIYVVGVNGIPGRCADIPVNWNQNWERPVHICYLDTMEQSQMEMNAGIKIAGNCTRTHRKKSFAITAKKKYGGDMLNYKFFNDRASKQYKDIYLRGNAALCGAALRDELGSVLCPGMDFETQSVTNAVLYLNGEYWGLYDIKERVNEHYIGRHFGLDESEFDMLEAGWDVINGSFADFSDLRDGYLYYHTSLENDEEYKYVTDRIDVLSYIDYIIAETFFGNDDWPYANIKYWCKKKSGKWRWILYDLDVTLGMIDDSLHHADSPYVFDTQLLSVNDRYADWTNRLFRRLVTNNNFLNAFTQIYAYHLSTTFVPDRSCNMLDSLKQVVDSEMSYECQRWNRHSVEEWGKMYNDAREYLQQRPSYMPGILQERFGVSGEFNVNISINKEDIPSDCEPDITLYGHSMQLPFEGKLFSGRPVSLEPVFDTEEYQVKYWEITHTDTDSVEYVQNDTLIIDLTDNIDIRLVLKEFTTGIEDESDINSVNQHNISIFPNPASQRLSISGISDREEYQVYDLTGNILKKGFGNSVDTSDLKDGIYLIRIYQNNYVTTTRFVIKQ